MDDGEYDDFFRSSYPRLVALGCAMSAPLEVAQELAQETLVRAYRRRDQLTAYDSPYGWCRRVMSNLLIDRYRSRRSERAAMGRLATLEAAGVDDRRFDPETLEDGLRWDEIVAPLTMRQRVIAGLYYVEDRSVRDIADDLGVTTGSVKSTLSQVRRNVERRLTDARDLEGSSS